MGLGGLEIKVKALERKHQSARKHGIECCPGPTGLKEEQLLLHKVPRPSVYDGRIAPHAAG